MAVGVAVFIVGILIIVVWLLVEMKRMRHKLFAIVLIILILLFYVSAYYVFKDREVDLKSYSGIKEASGIYFTYLGGVFGNMKSITTNAIKMNWGGSNSSLDPNLRD